MVELEAFLWGLAAGSSLVIGSAIGLYFEVSQRAIGLIMAFGAGALISALTFELTAEAYRAGGADVVALGLALGSATFYLGNRELDKRGGKHRKRSSGKQADGSPTGLVLGAVLDGIPESLVIGSTLLAGDGVGVAVVGAVFLSNLPEALAASTGMKRAGHAPRRVMLLWTSVALISALAATVGFVALEDVSESTIALLQAFAAGSILTMLADTMMPEAFDHGGDAVGVVTVIGFASAFMLSAF